MVPCARRAPLLRILVLVANAACAAAEAWSFRTFMAGDWDMERHSATGVDHAHYSLKLVGSSLEGTYHEDGEFGPTNEMVVRVIFDDPAGLAGSFQLAKVKAPDSAPDPAWENDDAPPEPQPMQQPEPKTAFDFTFRAQSDERFQVSESRWLGKAGGTVQFLATEDAFVFSKMVGSATGNACAASVTSWTAARRGAPQRPAGSASAKGDGRRSMLQRYGWYVLVAIAYFGYQAGKEMIAKTMGATKKRN